MNREIKFRAWHIDLEDMTFSIGNNSKFWSKVDEYPSMYHVMQYTGLKDKNGKEIYEGDIMCLEKYEGRKHQTRWVVEYNPEKGFKNWHSVPDDAIVIGNIYEHPQLLESEQKNSIANIDNQ